MNLSAVGSRKVLLTGAAALILVGGASVWGLSRWRRPSSSGVAVPAELTVDALKARSADGPRMMDTMRDTMSRDDLTDEQRRQIAQNVREVMRERIEGRVNEYYSASTEDRQAVLDRHIDEMEKQMKAMEERRKESERDRGERRADRTGPFGPQTQQERKVQSESRNPDEMARTMAYFSAVRARMSERGIKMPEGGGPGRPGGRGPWGP